jgi:hypothetical protein
LGLYVYLNSNPKKRIAARIPHLKVGAKEYSEIYEYLKILF